MKRTNYLLKSGTAILLMASFAAACGGSPKDDGTTRASSAGSGGATSSAANGGSSSAAGGAGAKPDTTAPTAVSVSPVDMASGVPINATLTTTFSEPMAPKTITAISFELKQGPTPVMGAVTYAGTVATLDPVANLAPNTSFTATVTTAVTDTAGNAMAVKKTWSFKTGTTVSKGPAVVNLGTAANYAILAKSGIDTVPASAITGNIAVSPIDGTGLTGFSLSMDSSNTFSQSAQVVGKLFAADYTPPTPSNLTTAVGNMEAAFTDAAGRVTPDFTELGAGDVSGLTLVPGLYKWGTGLLISSNVTLNGGANDVWIFQIAGGITVAPGAKIVMAGGALPSNVFWQAFGAVALNSASHFEGIILSKTEITLATKASVNGRLLAQTAVTLDAATVTQPAQ